MVGSQTEFERQRLFRDGVLTARGTFQKYYSQAELRAFLEDHLDREPVAIAPGMFFLFREDEDEQAFLVNERLKARNSEREPDRRLAENSLG